MCHTFGDVTAYKLYTMTNLFISKDHLFFTINVQNWEDVLGGGQQEGNASLPRLKAARLKAARLQRLDVSAASPSTLKKAEARKKR